MNSYGDGLHDAVAGNDWRHFSVHAATLASSMIPSLSQRVNLSLPPCQSLIALLAVEF